MNRREFALRNMVALAAAWSRQLLAEEPTRGIEPAPGAVDDILAGPPGGPWRRLFLDAAVVEQLEGLSRVYHSAEKFSGNPVIRRDKPWEGVSAIIGPYVWNGVLGR
jgi:hypothetical protein